MLGQYRHGADEGRSFGCFFSKTLALSAEGDTIVCGSPREAALQQMFIPPCFIMSMSVSISRRKLLELDCLRSRDSDVLQ